MTESSPEPALISTNPGKVFVFQTSSLEKASRQIDLLDMMEALFRERKHPVIRHASWLEITGSGFLLLPRLAGCDPMQNGGFHTVTTIQVHHPRLAPNGVFEYQHSWGSTVREAIAKGFDQWYQVDYTAFMDAVLPAAKTCMTLEISFPERDGQPAYRRRAVLSPVANLRAKPLPPRPDGSSEDHPFCPCCFFTNTAESYKELVETRAFVALRFYAARNDDGSAAADCRVNGDDFEAGMEALKKYVKKWPGDGFEFRRQYVLLHTLEG